MERLAAEITAPSAAGDREVSMDATRDGVRAVNRFLHSNARSGVSLVRIENPNGAHNLAVGVDADVEIHILGHAGYYAGGMNKHATVVIHGNVERGVAENMMSGSVRVKGNASESAGASAHGGLLIIEGNCAGRCGISLKGADIVVGGSVGHAAAFMAQAGRIVVCGDAGMGLGDSLYEAVIYVRGKIEGLGTDAREEPMTDADRAAVKELLVAANIDPGAPSAGEFKRVGSRRGLYHWNSANHEAY
jgi:glutamate synthase domain-containing protein 3